MSRIRWFALGWMLCAFCGCATKHQDSSRQNLYVVTVKFVSQGEKPLEKLEITTRPDAPFDVQVQDSAGYYYQAQGTLRQKSENSIRLENFYINSPVISAGPGSFPVELGKWDGVRAAATIVQGGYDMKVTRK